MTHRKIKVLIADDSATAREHLAALLNADPEIAVVGLASNGVEAVEQTMRLRPDVVIMDANMPHMDGFAATKQIMREVPTPIVMISNVLDVHDVRVSLDALRAGALTLLEKPPGTKSSKFEDAARQFGSTVKAMAGVKVVRLRRDSPSPPNTSDLNGIRSERPSSRRVRMIGMAASTGGPAALSRILSDLPPSFPVPILVVQHITPGFIDGLASWLNTTTSLDVRVARDGEPMLPSTVYLAGDDFHLGVSTKSRVALNGSAPIEGFRPSANYLFQSVAETYGSSALGVILTGMGRDGAEGLRFMREAGGQILAQDEASSAIFGMPQAAIAAGLAHHVLPLHLIGQRLVQMVSDPTTVKAEKQER